MPEVWVTMLSCSECYRRHDRGEDCDCWCHDGDETTFTDDGEPDGLGEWDW